MSGSLIFRAVAHCFRTLSLVAFDLVRLAFLAAHSRSALVAENLFLRKQLALFQERKAVCVSVPWARVEKYIPPATRVASAPIDTTIDEIRARIDILF
jgi:hypothetical protein